MHRVVTHRAPSADVVTDFWQRQGQLGNDLERQLRAMSSDNEYMHIPIVYLLGGDDCPYDTGARIKPETVRDGANFCHWIEIIGVIGRHDRYDEAILYEVMVDRRHEGGIIERKGENDLGHENN